MEMERMDSRRSRNRVEREERVEAAARPDAELAALEALLEEQVPGLNRVPLDDQDRIRKMARDLHARRMPFPFILSSVRASLQVLQEIRQDEERADNIYQRENVRRFIEENAVQEPRPRGRTQPRRERRREEREQLQAQAARLIREARLARGRHEVRKTRNMLLKLDQRELRRQLGREGDDLCRQINSWLRSTAAMF
jgi:hypothetical protein